MTAPSTRERRWWCERLGLSVWGPIDEKTVAEAANRSLVAVHPDKGNRKEGAGVEIREILRAKEAGKACVRRSRMIDERIAGDYEPMDWESTSF
jgi:hypothetical protein